MPGPYTGYGLGADRPECWHALQVFANTIEPTAPDVAESIRREVNEAKEERGEKPTVCRHGTD